MQLKVLMYLYRIQHKDVNLEHYVFYMGNLYFVNFLLFNYFS